MDLLYESLLHLFAALLNKSEGQTSMVRVLVSLSCALCHYRLSLFPLQWLLSNVINMDPSRDMTTGVGNLQNG